MKKIEHRGNMPNHVALFARQLTGQFAGNKETEFWEMSSVDEFEKKASEVGYEIIPAMDMVTKRGFLVGFDVEESEIKTLGGSNYAQLKMYYVECNEEEFKTWTNKIKTHRDQQQDDYFNRTSKKPINPMKAEDL